MVGTYFKQLEPSVEGAALDQVEPDVGISVVDPILTAHDGSRPETIALSDRL